MKTTVYPYLACALLLSSAAPAAAEWKFWHGENPHSGSVAATGTENANGDVLQVTCYSDDAIEVKVYLMRPHLGEYLSFELEPAPVRYRKDRAEAQIDTWDGNGLYAFIAGHRAEVFARTIAYGRQLTIQASNHVAMTQIAKFGLLGARRKIDAVLEACNRSLASRVEPPAERSEPQGSGRSNRREW